MELDIKVEASVTLSVEHSVPLPRLSNQTVTLEVDDKLSRRGELADITISAAFSDGTRMLLDVSALTLTSLNTSVAALQSQDRRFYVRAENEGTTEVIANWTVCGEVIALGVTEVQFERKRVPCFKEQVYRVSLLESTSIGDVLQLQIDVDSEDAQDAGVEFDVVSGNDAGKFDVNIATGLVRSIAALDREAVTMYALTVRVTDKAQREALRKLAQNQTETPTMSGSGVTSDPIFTDDTNLQACEASVYFTVLDVNDNSPSCSPVDVPLLSQAEKVGFEVATAVASDPDDAANGQITYSIVSGDTNERFGIDASSGIITIANNLSSVLTQYALQVEARDGGDRVDTCLVTVSTYNPSWQICVPATGITKDRFGTLKNEFEQRLGEILGLDVYITEYDSESQDASAESR